MTSDHRSTALLLAVLTIPFGIAIYQDATASENPATQDLLYGAGGIEFDESYDYDYDDDDDLAALEAEPESMPADFYVEVLYDGGKATGPTLAGPLANLRTGKKLLNIPEYYERWSYEGIPGHEHAYLSTPSRYQFYLSFPDDGYALRSLTAQWGQPATSTEDYETIYTWVNSSETLRARLVREEYSDTAEVQLELILTLEELVGDDSEIFGFEDSDVFALGADELSKIADFSDGAASVVLPPLTDVDATISVDIYTEDGHVQAMESSFSMDGVDRESLLGLLKKKMGAAKKSVGEWNTVHTFSKGKRVVEVTEDGSWLTLVIQQR